MPEEFTLAEWCEAFYQDIKTFLRETEGEQMVEGSPIWQLRRSWAAATAEYERAREESRKRGD